MEKDFAAERPGKLSFATVAQSKAAPQRGEGKCASFLLSLREARA